MPINQTDKDSFLKNITAKDEAGLRVQIYDFRTKIASLEIHEFLNNRSGEKDSLFDSALKTGDLKICLLLAANGASLDPKKKTEENNLCYISALKNFSAEQVLALVLRERLYNGQDFERSAYRIIVPGEMEYKRHQLLDGKEGLALITSPSRGEGDNPHVKNLHDMAETILSISEGGEFGKVAAGYEELLSGISGAKDLVTTNRASGATAARVDGPHAASLNYS